MWSITVVLDASPRLAYVVWGSEVPPVQFLEALGIVGLHYAVLIVPPVPGLLGHTEFSTYANDLSN